MKLVDKTLNYFEDFKQKYKFVIVPELLLLVFVVFWLIHQGRERFGNVLPDPINIFNHIGNVDSVVPALTIGFLMGFIAVRTLKLSKRQFLWLGILVGAIAGLACNILIETSWGMQLLHEQNTSDILDVVWGTTFCLLTCWAVFRVRDKK